MKNKKFGLSAILAIVIGVVVLAGDLFSKYLIEASMMEGEVASFLPGFMNIIVVHNNGAAWGSFAGKQVMLIVLTFILIAIFLAFYIVKSIKSTKPVSVTLGVAVGLIAGGCFGNLYDRLVFGYVRDFLNFEFMNFPVFNIADTALCVGIVVLCVYFIFIYSREGKKEKPEKKDNE